MNRREKYKAVIDWFSVNMPNVKSELNYTTPFELLVAVVLSAQCRDDRVNLVTPKLFKAFPNAQAMSLATVTDIFDFIKSISFPNNKALHLSQLSKKLVSDFNGVVPSDMDALQTLPGVGRKTANVVRAVAFGIPSMPVDTHVFRVSERLGLSVDSKTPEETEKQLVTYIPEQYLTDAHHWILLHGRYICKARKPMCEKCPFTALCNYFASIPHTN